MIDTIIDSNVDEIVGDIQYPKASIVGTPSTTCSCTCQGCTANTTCCN